MIKEFQENTMRRFFVGDNLAINRLKNTVVNILSSTGVTVNGNDPWDINIKNENFYNSILCDLSNDSCRNNNHIFT